MPKIDKFIKAIIFIFGLYVLFSYIGKEYDCLTDCALKDAGAFSGLFILIVFVTLFFEKVRNHSVEILKIYIPAMFILYSATFYMDNIQHEENLKVQKEYIKLKLKYASLDIKNIDKDSLNKVISEGLIKYNEAFESYVNKTINNYKTIIGKSMIGLTIGLLIIMMLDILKIWFKEKKMKEYSEK